MRFITRKRRQPPSVILISLIDILLVLLIFLMMTTTFKRFPSLELTLPESNQASRQGNQQVDLLVTVAKQAPHLYLGKEPIAPEKLEEAFQKAVKQDPESSLAIRADTDAPWGMMMRVIEAAKNANLRSDVATFTQEPGVRSPTDPK